MLKKVWYAFMALALVELLASFTIHILAWFEFKMPLAVFGLYLGIVVLWFPMAIASFQLAGFTWSWNYYQRVLRGCPAWMRSLAQWSNLYVILNFLGAFVSPNSAQLERHFSSVWMAFYFTAFATLYSAIHVDDGHCTNGHKLLPYKKICPECGALRAEVR